MSVSGAATREHYVFCSPEGFEKVRSTVKGRLPYVPHDYQLEGVCKLLDGHDLIAVLPTGAGKTGYFVIYILMLLALAEDPKLCQLQGPQIAPDPCIVVVYPTNGLEEEQAAVFENSQVTTVVINAGTLKKARESTPPVDLWTVARHNVAVILLSPEMLTSPRFDSLLEHPHFQSRVYALAIDEIHLLYSWGQNFRQSFRQLGLVRARFPMRTRLVGTTATLLSGHTQSTILSFLGLEKESFHFIRRSNIRHNVQTIFRTLTHGLGGWDFPDLRWILRDNRRTVIHCRTIALSFRVASYLWHLCPPSGDRVKRIRLYNALNWPTYNAESRRLMKEAEEAQVIVATASFMVGIDLPNIEDVVVVGNLVSADEHVQWEGRPGRNPALVSNARCITYVTKKALSLARSLLDGKTKRGAEKTGDGKKKSGVHMEISMARLLLAPCVTIEQNLLYANPPSDPLCLCAVCTLARTHSSTTTIRIQCTCSGCMPEDQPASLISRRKDENPIPRRRRLTREMRAEGVKELRKLRMQLYRADESAKKRSLTPEVYLPEITIKLLLDRFALINTHAALEELLADRVYILPHSDTLWTTLQTLASRFEEMRKAKEEERRRARQEKALESEAGEHSADAGLRAKIATITGMYTPPVRPFDECCATFQVTLEQSSGELVDVLLDEVDNSRDRRNPIMAGHVHVEWNPSNDSVQVTAVYQDDAQPVRRKRSCTTSTINDRPRKSRATVSNKENKMPVPR